jgi:transcriptional regulator with XRE-family HTH domain
LLSLPLILTLILEIMIKDKLIAARKEKNKTQNDIAKLLYMSQSQYQRREYGEIRISDDEWMRLAEILEKEVGDIKEEDSTTTIYNYDNYSGNYSASNNYFYNIPDFIMKNQQDYIEMLKRENEDLKSALDKK